MPKNEDSWGNNCFSGFVAILGFGIMIGGWISGAGFWIPFILGLLILGLGEMSMGRH
jgi:hypothetical protein